MMYKDSSDTEDEWQTGRVCERAFGTRARLQTNILKLQSLDSTLASSSSSRCRMLLPSGALCIVYAMVA